MNAAASSCGASSTRSPSGRAHMTSVIAPSGDRRQCPMTIRSPESKPELAISPSSPCRTLDAMADVRLVIHGHFYQPPRENPWTEEVATELSAAPYHDWNERITAECYRPNGWARVLDDAGRVEGIVNNYGHLSFDAGPTLLSWLERHQPAVYRRMQEADAESGGAIAQAYNHAILPLANERDIRTQVRWGLADFAHRFGRPAEGMWLPETAVN